MTPSGPFVDVQAVQRAVEAQGVSWEALTRRAEEIVLFGSRAAGLSRVDSDFDLLLIGDGEPCRTATVDWVWVSLTRARSRRWLGGELAGHVARYGIWLWGTPRWIGEVWGSDEALAHKASLVTGRLEALARSWSLLARPYRRKHLLLLRRELQRHAALLDGDPVPPTAVLDHAWSCAAAPSVDALALAERVSARAKRLLERVLAHGGEVEQTLRLCTLPKRKLFDTPRVRAALTENRTERVDDLWT